MMRLMERNKQTFWYARYEGKFPVTEIDEDGNLLATGEYLTKYTEPTAYRGSISPASGTTAQEVFGTADGYDKVILVANPFLSIDEYCVVWLDDSPFGGKGRDVPYNYTVKRIARSLNYCAIAVQKVDVSA